MLALRALTVLTIIVTAGAASLPVHAATPTHQWSQRFGSTSDDLGMAVAVDASSNVLVTGLFTGTVNFGGAPLMSAGAVDIYLAKYDANGVHQWSQRFGSTGQDWSNSVTVDASGNVFIAGFFNGTVDFGGVPLTSTGAEDIFVAKYNSSGVHQWSQRFGSSVGDIGYAVTADGSGGVIVTGFFQGTVDFGGGPLVSSGAYDLFVAKYNASGVHQWSQRFGSTSFDIGYALDVDASGSVFVTGYFGGTVTFGGGVLVSAGGFDIFVAKYNSSGVHQWSQRFGDTGSETGLAVAVDGSGSVFATGHFEGTVDFGGSPLVSAGADDIFVAKYTSAGVHVWSQRYGSTSNDHGNAVDVDALGNVVLIGHFRETVDFGGIPLVGSGDDDIFIAKYSTSGLHLWSQGFGSASFDRGLGVGVDASTNVFVAGAFGGPLNFGGGTLASEGPSDVFLAKFGPVADPVITSVIDVGNDQGREVEISFSRSGHDSPGAPPSIVQYEAFRRDDPVASATGTVETERAIISSPAMTPTDWAFVGAVPAHGELDYNIFVPTAADSTIAEGQHYSVFFVRAATVDPFTFFDSPIDSGYSVDNLAPSAPANFSYTAGVLSWRESNAADFDYFSVYGSASQNFNGSAVHIGHTTGLSLDVSSSPYAFYYVTATDFAGNEGEASRVGTLSGIDETPTYTLAINAYPNPFNPRATIRYDVPSRGRVAVSVYDARGSLVVRLVNMDRDAGSYSVPWAGQNERGVPVSSGVYLAKLEFGGDSRTMKLVLLK